MTTETPPRSLMDVLNFTDADLAANRSGLLSEAQKDRLSKTWRRTLNILIVTLLGVGLVATLFLFSGEQTGSSVLSFVGVGLTVLNAAIMGIGASNYLRIQRDIRDGQTAELEGTIRHTIRVSGRARTYLLDIQNERLAVPRATFQAFEEGAAYRLYRAPMTKTLFSAEKL